MEQCQEYIFITLFKPVEDPRIDRNKLYPLDEILLVAFATILSGGEGYSDMHEFGLGKLDFFREFLPFENGIASEDTFERVFSLINPRQFEQCFTAWINHIKTEYADEILALDGKQLRRSGSEARRPLHVVSAWASRNRLVLGCHAVEEKSNEITAIPEILKLLSLKGTTVTTDAIGCQKAIVQNIVQQGGDLVIALKQNQPTLHDDVKTYLDHEVNQEKNELMSYSTLEKDHGRIEKREYFLSTTIKWLRQRHPEWPIKAIGMVKSKRTIRGKEQNEVRYYITTHTDIHRFSNAVRAHWGVENAAHGVLDITFHEDLSRVRNRNAAANLAILRRLAMNLLEKDTTPKRSKRRKRLKAGWDTLYLKTLLTTGL